MMRTKLLSHKELNHNRGVRGVTSSSLRVRKEKEKTRMKSGTRNIPLTPRAERNLLCNSVLSAGINFPKLPRKRYPILAK